MIGARQDPFRRLAVRDAVRRTALAVCVTGALANGVAASPARIVAGDPAIVTLLDEATEQSETLRGLLDRLDRTRWLVFAQYGRCPARPAVACLLHFVGDFRGRPYLRILIDRSRLGSREDQIGLLAHELYHALEAAECPDVVDAPSLTALFSRIGQVSAWSQHVVVYETAAARRTEQLVISELNRRR